MRSANKKYLEKMQVKIRQCFGVGGHVISCWYRGERAAFRIGREYMGMEIDIDYRLPSGPRGSFTFTGDADAFIHFLDTLKLEEQPLYFRLLVEKAFEVADAFRYFHFVKRPDITKIKDRLKVSGDIAIYGELELDLDLPVLCSLMVLLEPMETDDLPLF